MKWQLSKTGYSAASLFTENEEKIAIVGSFPTDASSAENTGAVFSVQVFGIRRQDQNSFESAKRYAESIVLNRYLDLTQEARDLVQLSFKKVTVDPSKGKPSLGR